VRKIKSSTSEKLQRSSGSGFSTKLGSGPKYCFQERR